MTKEFFTEFYIESKGLLEKRAEEKVLEDKDKDFEIKLAEVCKNADWKQTATTFAKNHRKAVESGVAGATLGGISELAMPSRTDQFGRPSTNLTEIGKRALLGGTLGAAGGEIKNRTGNYINKLGQDKTAIIGPLVDGGALMIPSIVGYHMGKKKGQESYAQGKPMQDVSQAKLWLLPGMVGHTIGEANAHIDSYLNEKRDTGTLDDYYNNHTDEKVRDRYSKESPYMKQIMEGEWKRRVHEMNRKDAKSQKVAGLSDFAGSVFGNAAGAASKIHDLGSRAGQFLKDPVTKRTLIGGGIGASLGIPAGLMRYEKNKRIEEGKDYPIEGLDFLAPKPAGIMQGIGTGLTMGASGAAMGNMLGKNPHLESALIEGAKKLKGFVTPDTSSVKNFLKDPVVQHGALGAGSGAAFGLGASAYNDPETGDMKFDPNISAILGGAAIGGGLGLASGGLTRAHNQLDTMSGMVDAMSRHGKEGPVRSAVNDALKMKNKGLPPVKGHQVSPGVEVLPKTAGAMDFIAKHPIMSLGGGGALLGAGLGAAGQDEGNRLKGALSGAAVLGGIGTGAGMYLNSRQLMHDLPEKFRGVRSKWEDFKYGPAVKQAFMAPLMQRAGALAAKNPRAAGAIAGAGVGALGNTLSGEDNLGFSMAAGAGLGALGGKGMMNMAKKQNSPIFGQNFRRGAITERLNMRNAGRTPPIQAQSMKSAPSLDSLVQNSGAKNVGPTGSNIPHNPITTPKAPQEMNWDTVNQPSFTQRASQKLRSLVG